tara:strand:+ start:1727 stop:2110 length:384 start_codon:yes stop_codon:yes gene_type:complete
MTFTFDGRKFDLSFFQADASKANRSRIVDAIAAAMGSYPAPEDVAMLVSYESNRIVTIAAIYDRETNDMSYGFARLHPADTNVPVTGALSAFEELLRETELSDFDKLVVRRQVYGIVGNGLRSIPLS